MKLFKYIIYLILIILIGASIYIATLKSDYDIKETQLIKAPISVVFNEINDYKNWEHWGPWYEEDSTIIASYPQNTSGVNASYTWTGKEGNGSMKTLSLIPNKEIIQQIDFETGSKPTIYWEFKPVDNGTELTWGMKGKNTFMEKAFWLTQGGIEKGMKPMMNRGLTLIDNYLQKEMKKYNISDNGVVMHGGGYYLYKTASCKISEIDQYMENMFGEIMTYMTKNNVQPSGNAFSITHKWDEKNGTTMFSTAMPVAEKMITSEGILSGYLNPQKALKTTLTGDYSNLKEAYETAFKNIQTKKLKEVKNGEPFEVYVVGPHITMNPSKWKTEIFIPVE